MAALHEVGDAAAAASARQPHRGDTELRRVDKSDASTRQRDESPTSGSRKREYGIMASVVLTQLVQFWPYGAGLVTAISIATSINNHSQASTEIILPQDEGKIAAHAAWLAASYPLTNGTFILMSGRLGEVYGHKLILLVGSIFWLIWHLGSGLATNIIGLCFMRGLAGIGGALMVPNAVAMLGHTFPPGRRRNLAMGLFGAMAPIGAGVGALASGVLVQRTEWRWVFFVPLLLGTVTYSAAMLFLPWDQAVDSNGSVDWVGAYFGVTGLILFNFSWNQAPAVGWSEPYIYIILIVGIAHMALFCAWEARVAKSPILPFDIWKAKSFGTLLVLCGFSFMSLGIFLWYYTVFGIKIRNYSSIETGANFTPLTLLGGVAAGLAAWLVPRVPAQYIIAIGNAALVICNVLLATTPRHQTWWAMMFPAICIDAFSVDLIFAASQIIASGSVGRKNQGVAGSLIGTLQTYGLSTGLGFAGTVEYYTNNNGQDLLSGYRHAFYLAIGLAGAGLAGSLLFLRMPKRDQEGWDEDGPAV